MKHCFGRVLSLAAVVLIATSMGATTLKKMGNDEMAVKADCIVVGRAVSASTHWVDKTLMTEITIQVEDAYKGAVVDEVSLIIPGGMDANRAVPVAVTFPGAPSLFQGEDVLLFLSDSATISGAFDVVGFNQGKFTVFEDPSGVRMVTSAGGAGAIPLESMKGQIQSALAGQR